MKFIVEFNLQTANKTEGQSDLASAAPNDPT